MSDDREERLARIRARKEARAAEKSGKESTSTDKPAESTVVSASSAAAATTNNMSPGEWHPADTNGDGIVSPEEEAMYLEFKRKELEDADAMRDAQRSMAWFALFGMLLYPFAVVLAVLINLEQAAKILGDMAATYFVSVAAIVAAFFGGQAYQKKSSSKTGRK